MELVLDKLVTFGGVSEMSGIFEFVRGIVWQRAENTDMDQRDFFFECFYGHTCDGSDDDYHRNENLACGSIPPMLQCTSIHTRLRACYRTCPTECLDSEIWEEVQFQVCKSMAGTVWRSQPELRDNPELLALRLDPLLDDVWASFGKFWPQIVDEGAESDCCYLLYDKVEAWDLSGKLNLSGV
jgi:hypothetical protein